MPRSRRSTATSWPRSTRSGPDGRSRRASTSTARATPTYDFFVVVSGAVDIVLHADGEERVITRHGAGRFLGELNMLTGLRVFVSARVAEAGEVIVVPVADPATGARDAAGAGRHDPRRLHGPPGRAAHRRRAAIRVVGSRFSPDSQRVREFLARSRIPHEWLDPDHDDAVDRLLRELGVTTAELPGRDRVGIGAAPRRRPARWPSTSA